jgi:hypothetical protein
LGEFGEEIEDSPYILENMIHTNLIESESIVISYAV